MMIRSAAVRVSPQREFVVHVCNVDGCVLVASFIWQVELFLFCDMDVTKNSHSNGPTYVHMYHVYVSLPLEQVAKSTARVHFRRRSVAGSAAVCQQRCLFVVPNCSARRNDILALGNQPDAQDPHSSIISRYQSSAALVDDDDTSHDNTKVVPFLLADIGEGIAEVELLQWFVEPGMRVQQFDRVCEVQSDKATVEITSRFDGVIDSLNGQVGEMISVGSPLLHIAVEDSASTPSPEPPASAPTPVPTLHNIDDKQDRLHIPQVASTLPDYDNSDDVGANEAKRRTPFKVLATPAVRKLGMDHDIDLGSIAGTGPKGRILKGDLLKIIKAKEGHSVFQPPTGIASPSSAGEPVLAAEVVPIRGYNRLMVKSMTESLQVPQMCYSDEINMNALKLCREELRPLAASQGVKLSYLPFLIKSASLAIADYPVLNSSINVEDFTLTYHNDHNIGVAMDSPRGLVVPVVKKCQSLSILDIARELTRLQEAAKEGSLSEDDITGVTFSLSNIGAIGGTYMSPIVAPPQVAIGAIGTIQRLPRFVGDSNEVEEASIMQISWGGDHRVVDGATMARFSNQWKAYLERPMTMTFSMN